MGLFQEPPMVNSRGDTLSEEDKKYLGETQVNKLVGHKDEKYVVDPVKRSEMLLNWLTAGGPPKPIEPGKIFKEKQGIAGVEDKAAAGQGINSLFGVGKMIGDLIPKIEPLDAGAAAIKPLKMIEPLNTSPMQPGVPYSAIPLPGGK